MPYLLRADEVLETGGMFKELFETAEALGQPIWLLPYLDAEWNATQLRCYQPTLIPGLLQTERYARAVIRTDVTLTEPEIERRLTARMSRQTIFDAEAPPQLVAVIDDVVLRRTDEEFQEVMAEQVAHLIGLAERPNISVHVIPSDVAMHVGLTGPFILARSAVGEWTGNLETQLGGTLVDKLEELDTLPSRWEAVRNEAMSHRQSIERMKEVVKSWA